MSYLASAAVTRSHIDVDGLLCIFIIMPNQVEMLVYIPAAVLCSPLHTLQLIISNGDRAFTDPLRAVGECGMDNRPTVYTAALTNAIIALGQLLFRLS